MGVGDVEVLDRIAVVVGIGEHLGSRVDRQLVADQALACRFLGLHPQFHQAFPNRLGVTVLGVVPDLEQHQACNLCSIG